MISFSKRRVIGISAVTASVVILLSLHAMWRDNLVETSVYSGLLLLFLVFSLITLNIRKRFSFLPIGRVSTWLQVHLYVAWFTIALFFTHIGFKVPRGGLESVLAVLFGVVALSGIIGLIFTRMLPRFLTDRGGNVAFDEIPHLRRRIKMEAEDLIINSVESQKPTIADFYVDRLEEYFIGSRRSLFNHLIGSNKHLEFVLNRMNALKRYLNKEELEIFARLEKLVIERDNLDYQYTFLFLLKTWLFVHVPLSYALLFLGIAHGFLAYRFVGS